MACAGTIAGAMAGLILASAEPVVVGTAAPFPDYIDLDAEGEIVGYERDLMDEVCARATLDCRWRLANFDELIPGVMSGQFDVVLGGMAVTEERRALVAFTQSYYTTDPEEWYIGRPGAPEPDQALTAVQSGTMHEAHLRQLDRRHLSFQTEPEVLAALAEGRVDLALGPFKTRGAVQDFLAANGIDALYPELIPDDGVAMAVCKGNPLLDRLDAALDAMRQDGALAAIESRWFQ